MADSLYNIFGDHVMRQAVKNVTRQPFSNIENMGKTVSSGPIKPNEPVKKIAENKKSFLSNTGKTLQATPMRKVFTPRAVNVGSLIYTDNECVSNDKSFSFAEMEFTKPLYKYDQSDLLDYLTLPEPELTKHISPPNTPPPAFRNHSLEFDCSYQDEFFTDDFSNESIPEEDLGLPNLY